MKLLYFAWLKTQIGKSEETLDPPASVATVADLLDWLPQQGAAYGVIAARRATIRVAVNQEFARPDQRLSRVPSSPPSRPGVTTSGASASSSGWCATAPRMPPSPP